MTSPLKPLDQCCSNFMWSLLLTGEKRLQKMVVIHRPKWLPCPYMVKTFKNLLLQNQISPGLLSLHKLWGTGDLQKLLNGDPMLTFDLFTSKSNLLSRAFVWAIYIYMGKMLRTHNLDISSIIQLNRNLMMSIRAPSRHTIAK